MTITIPVEGSDETLTNATSPAGYTMHINISLYNLIRVRASPRSFARASRAHATRALNAETVPAGVRREEDGVDEHSS